MPFYAAMVNMVRPEVIPPSLSHSFPSLVNTRRPDPMGGEGRGGERPWLMASRALRDDELVSVGGRGRALARRMVDDDDAALLRRCLFWT